MTILLLCLSLMLTMLLVVVARAWQAPRSRPAVIAVEPPPAAPIALSTLRPSPRVAVQTSAALLAIALALDVSGPAQAFAMPAEDGVYVAQALGAYALPDAEAVVWTPVELAPDWAFKAISSTDGWLI